MKLNEYQDMARETAIYAGALYYPALGLAGEVCEALEKANDFECSYDEQAAEIGDVLWYVANVAKDAGLTLSECATENFDDLGLPHEDDLELALICAVGPIFETVKKCIRDEQGHLTKEKREKIRVSLGITLNVLAEIAIELGTTLEKIAEANYDKLKSRQERGKLHGSGDNR